MRCFDHMRPKEMPPTDRVGGWETETSWCDTKKKNGFKIMFPDQNCSSSSFSCDSMSVLAQILCVWFAWAVEWKMKYRRMEWRLKCVKNYWAFVWIWANILATDKLIISFNRNKVAATNQSTDQPYALNGPPFNSISVESINSGWWMWCGCHLLYRNLEVNLMTSTFAAVLIIFVSAARKSLVDATQHTAQNKRTERR